MNEIYKSMKAKQHRLIISDRHFEKLVNGEEIVILSRVNSDSVHLILNDIGFGRMIEHIDNALVRSS